MSFLDALIKHDFLQYALLAGILASIGCGIMGTYVLVKRISFLAGGIAHTVLAGMGAAYYFGAAPMGGALVSALLAAWLIGWVSLRRLAHADTLISALWAMGMAAGILFISKSPGYNTDLMSYLFGNILMVMQRDLYFMAALDAIIALTTALFYKQFLAVCLDEEFARLRGVYVDFFYLLLLSLVALTVVLLIRVAGLILVIALLTLPAAIAAQYARSLGRIMLFAAVLGMAFNCGGLILSYELDLPAGATIILLAGFSYFLSIAGKIFLKL
ncbi:MAG: metal ABC transporter permease [Gammaproteobacteria bacterium]|nr:metal ABC transporter permease [Gammaproteobacteria bacterium]